ncbi:hypothetical protein BJF93_12790 [Xaviernesmea oryzae]|uniref:General secretion pathway protein GspM n=1 Tax=Xaviernesmea oryzae TaxID=464029 RepID=A0A1Q9AQT5_9HYPH|nr:type II secretion system protein GspM [Xaviernesmea oryzae]OLP57739.1 hypothetical protein BJF93_12790 [Xaviernesmea oryzae]SEM06245.1 Type II secretion system (T2SS), protein M subtype b [Xaviernesmea oryzae]
MSAATHAAWRPLPSVALLLAVLLVGTGLLATDLLAIRVSGDEIAAREGLADSLQRAIDKTLAAAAPAKSAPEGSGAVLPGESPTIAAAALQGAVIDIVQNRGAEVLSTEPNAEGRADNEIENAQATGAGLRPIRLDVTFDARIEDAQAILFAIETGHPVMIVDRLQLTPARQLDGQSDSDPLLHLVMALHGYWRAP